MKMTHGQMEQMILNDGYSIAVVSKMSIAELEQAASYEDYREFTRFMRYVCNKYDR